MRVIVNNASCLIDLHKGGLLNVLCRLRYSFVVPLPIRESEILGFSDQEWQQLDESGMITYDLTSDEVSQALVLKKTYPDLSSNDCFCSVTATAQNGILLTGDAQLRKVAKEYNLAVHGVLWVIDEFDITQSCARSQLIHALERRQVDDAVFLPKYEISIRLEKLAKSRRRSQKRMNRPFGSPMRSVAIVLPSS